MRSFEVGVKKFSGVVFREIKGTSFFGGDLFEDRLCLRVPCADYGGNTGLEYAGLLVSYCGPGATEHFAMVQPDACDYAGYRGDDIGAVESASKACFYDSNIHVPVCKPLERHARSDLEK
ncbi:unknown [Bacteroides sp. CAG:1060]|nr:unknown [Bacteroides sp. CAG:1060]